MSPGIYRCCVVFCFCCFKMYHLFLEALPAAAYCNTLSYLWFQDFSNNGNLRLEVLKKMGLPRLSSQSVIVMCIDAFIIIFHNKGSLSLSLPRSQPLQSHSLPLFSSSSPFVCVCVHQALPPSALLFAHCALILGAACVSAYSRA